MDENLVTNCDKINGNVDRFNKLNSIRNKMILVNDSIKELFLCEEPLNDHDSFLLFRGKVSKRIVNYSHLILQYNQIRFSENDENSFNEEYEYHLRSIENYKRELSLWWSKMNESYIRLCMSLFLDKKESGNHVTNMEEKDKNFSNINLKDTKKMMMDEVNRMKNVKSELLESSQKLKKQDEIFNSFETKLRFSAQLIFSLKKKAEDDQKYVWYSFFFFLSICVYIILRRLGFIRAILMIIKWIILLLFNLGKMCSKLLTIIKNITFKKENQIEHASKSTLNGIITNEL